MYKTLFFLLIIITLTLMACSGKDRITVDHTPPLSPVLIPHLGDYGDDPVIYNNQTIFLTDDNNGIDAVPDGDWLRVSWEHFLDSDLDYAKIYRFDEFNQEPVLIDSIDADNDYYLDSSPLSTNVRYYYFVEVVDFASNTALSDTVAYKLLSKQLLVEPANHSYVDPDSIMFAWNKSGFITKFRLLVFDDNHDYLWHNDIDVSFEGDYFEVHMPSNWQQTLGYDGDFLYWRVDAFDWDSELGILIGSESNEWIVYLQNKK